MKKLGIVVVLFFGIGISSVYAINISSQDILEGLNATYVEAAKQVQGATIPAEGFDFNPAYQNQPQFKSNVDELAQALNNALAKALGKRVDQITPEDIQPSTQTKKWNDLVDEISRDPDVARLGRGVLDTAEQEASNQAGKSLTGQLRTLVDQTL